MIAGLYNIICQQGSTFGRTITYKYLDPASPPSDPRYLPWNLTGFTARMQVRRTVDSSTVLISLTTENGRVSLGGPSGIIELNISAADTATITGSGVYDLEVISPNGIVSRIIQGDFTLSQEVTR
jgi:hypothetical protein